MGRTWSASHYYKTPNFRKFYLQSPIHIARSLSETLHTSMVCLLNLIRGLFCIFRALSTACWPKFPRRATYLHILPLKASSCAKYISRCNYYNKQGRQEMALSAIHIYPQRKPCNPFKATYACTSNQSKVFSYKSLTLYIAKNEHKARNREYYYYIGLELYVRNRV